MSAKSGAQRPVQVKDSLTVCLAVFVKYTAIPSHLFKRYIFF